MYKTELPPKATAKVVYWFLGMQELIKKLIQAEIDRQKNGLDLIPSENYVSCDVLTALGTVYTNKYSEGYPGRRYYGGQVNTDQVETLAIERAKQLFGADHANVQPHSGTQANQAVYHAWLSGGDKVLAMDLSHGGHLSHGHPITTVAGQYKFISYGMADTETGEIDYDNLADLAQQHRPKLILAGFSAYPRQLDYPAFARIADSVGAVFMADMAHIAGLIAAGVLVNPLDHGAQVITATTHKTLRGPRGGLIVSKGDVLNPSKAPAKTIVNLPTMIDRAIFPALQGGPIMNNILAKAVAFGEALEPAFKDYAQTILDNAQALAKALKQRNFKLVTGGTDNHLILLDVYSSHQLDGAQAETILEAIGLTCNKNVIPGDERPAYSPSGLRIGTPALTTRGLKPKDMIQIADWFDQALSNKLSSSRRQQLRKQVADFARQSPPPSL